MKKFYFTIAIIVLLTALDLKAQDPCNPVYPIAGLGQAYQQTFAPNGSGAWTMTLCGASSSLIEKVYSFNAPYTATYKLVSTGGSCCVVYAWKQGTCDQTTWNCIGNFANGTYGSVYWTPGTYYILLKSSQTNIYANHNFYIICEPNAPNLLSATAVATNQVNLSWTDVDGETGFKIYRAASLSGPWTQIGTTTANTTTYSDIGLTANTNYCYDVAAFNNDATGMYSNHICVTTFANPPTTPLNLIATASTSGQINLSWNDVATEIGYKIYRKLNPSGTYSLIATIAQDLVTFSDTGLLQNNEYCYKIKSYNTGGESGFSNESCAMVNPDISPMPTNLSATAVSANQVNLTWNDVAGEDGYKIFRSSTLTGTYTQIAIINTNIVSFANTGLSAGTQYCYKVKSYNTGGESAYSNASCANTCTSAPNPPFTPSNLTATPIGCGQIGLTWDDVSTEEGYNIYRADSVNGNYLFLDCTDDNQTTYLDIDLPLNTNFCYKVKAYNTGGESGFSNNACNTTLSVKNYDGADNLIKVYPNPAIDNLIIEIQDQKLFLSNNVQITDVQGKVILKQGITQTQTEINISSFAPGIYFIKIESDKEVIMKKFVKE